MTSLKKLIAVLAVSLPLAASAQQAAAPAAPLYQIYGTLNVNGQYVEISRPAYGKGTNIAGRTAVSTDSSNIGIRGTADTGQAGLSVVYQCETSAAVDGDGVSGICNRNSRLGLSHAYGTLFYGNWDSPYKAVWYGTKADDAFGNTDIYDAAGLMGSPGFKTKSSAGLSATGPAVPPATGTAATGSATFNVRTANSVTYFSPKVEGVQLKAQYGTNERASNNGALTGALYSAALNYDRGPLSVLAAYERHDDWSGLNVVGAIPSTGAAGTNIVGAKSTVDQGVRVGAGYEIGTPYGATTIGAVWELLTLGYANTHPPLVADQVKEVKRQAIMGNLKHRMGNHELRLRYAYADHGSCKLFNPTPGSTCTTAGFGAQQYALGYAYYLSAAAQVYAYYTRIENERNATYTFATGGPAALTAAWSAGADPIGAGLGLRYAF
jgi:predicted porin